MQLPTWYELWWDNGYYPGQPAADFMFGAWPGNMTEVSRRGCRSSGTHYALAAKRR